MMTYLGIGVLVAMAEEFIWGSEAPWWLTVILWPVTVCGLMLSPFVIAGCFIYNKLKPNQESEVISRDAARPETP